MTCKILTVIDDNTTFLDGHNVVLVGISDGSQNSVGVSSDHGEVAIDSVASQKIVAFTREGKVASVECEDMLPLDHHGVNYNQQKNKETNSEAWQRVLTVVRRQPI